MFFISALTKNGSSKTFYKRQTPCMQHTYSSYEDEPLLTPLLAEKKILDLK